MRTPPSNKTSRGTPTWVWATCSVLAGVLAAAWGIQEFGSAQTPHTQRDAKLTASAASTLNQAVALSESGKGALRNEATSEPPVQVAARYDDVVQLWGRPDNGASALPVSHASWDRGETTPDKADAVGPVVAPADMRDPQPPRLLMTPVAEPSDVDTSGQNTSATAPIQTVSTKDKQALLAFGGDASGPSAVTAMASTVPSVLTPAQVKQAYGFASLPAGTVSNKFAYQGSGQVIVVIDAFHSTTVAADLNTFSSKFGLPTCASANTPYQAGKAITSLVTQPQPGDGCSFQVLYVNAAGTQSATPPRVDAGWAGEIALDVQWVHAIAPMAKIVLVEAASNSGNDLMNAMAFASKLGATAVTMSYGAPEFSTGPNYDGIMSGSAVWVASTGDNGVGTNWPASSSKVLGVGGTLLSNISPRAEVGWTGSGGGLTKYVPMPSWQSTVTVPGNPANTAANASKMRRGLPDVAYNASPNSGVFVVLNGSWYGMGGTSAGSPQWAALAAIVNGTRKQLGKASLAGSAFQQALYAHAAVKSNYLAGYLDVVSGSNGTCVTCKATGGYDLVTGLGSPNVASLVPSMVALP